ncbi:phosphotransferase [Oceanobacillus sojae]|uniref:phosphotransferase n=1 Tax=Oceanobacillus sojae TaxID=582851 RepID=UPI0009FC6F69|nr:phosphotransferase [Oceanobacillus sojae]
MIKEYNKVVQARKAKILELSPYLENGQYTFDKDLRTVYNTAKTSHPMVNNLKNSKEEGSPSLEMEDYGRKYFNGSILWFCINGDIRIFSDDEILVICTNQESYQRKIANYTYFSSFFRIPALLKQDAKHNMVTETFIHFENQTENDEAFILKTIYDDYHSYFNYLMLHSKVDYQTLNSLFDTSSNVVHIQQFEKIIEKVAPELLSLKLPFIDLHGDLWSDNILLNDEAGEKTLWYIDWETADKYVFFYDFFKFIWNELDVHDNYSCYKRYIAGEFDEGLTRLFAIFHLKFQPKYRQSYFCLFFLNSILNDTDNIAFKFKLEEINDFKRKVFPLMI